MLDPEHLKNFLGGQCIEEIDLLNLADVSSWKRTIASMRN
jgi:hypothetical protein